MYINTYLIPVPEDRKQDYTRMAERFADVTLDCGALEVAENWEQDVPDGERTDFRRAVLAEPGERVVVSWVVWPDRATADRAHKAMFEDGRLDDVGEMPFDGARLVLGGFEPLLYRRRD